MNKLHFTKVIKIGSPLLIGMISEYLMHIADSVMVGRLGTTYLAGIAIAFVFTEILWCVVWPLAPGVQTIAARRFGQQTLSFKNDERTDNTLARQTGETLDNGIIIALILSVFVVLFAAFAEDILSLMIHDQDRIAMAMEYIGPIKWIMPLAAIFFACYGFLAAINMTKLIMIFSIVVNLSNIMFNYILIFGKFGMPAMGIKGAAYGTIISIIMGVISLVIIILSLKPLRKYCCFTFKKLDLFLIRDMIKVTLPVVIQSGFILSAFLVYESLISNIGTLELAVTHILIGTFHFFRFLIGGFAEGGSVLVGNALGIKDKKEAYHFAGATNMIAIVIAMVIFLFIMLFPELVIKIFNTEPETVALGSKAVRYFGIFFLIAAIGTPVEILFTHNGWGKFVLYSDISTNILCLLGITVLSTMFLGMGINGAWIALALYLFSFNIILYISFFSKKWLNVNVESSEMAL
ncbi:MAG: MATE family efflux transporter [Desulfobacterales bacterium]|nr:MATE family efflux transporter [Desulfobacterales bacterium]